jgi:hypothetical protein
MLPVLLGVTAIGGAAEAQTSLTAVILHGASTRAGSTQPGTPTMLAPGVRVESPRASWTEIAFSDGSSVVLDPGADFTLQGIEKDTESGHLVVRAASGRGRLRLETSDSVEILLTTPGAQVRVVGATAVVNAGRAGSATLISGRRLVVQRGAEEDVVRRPGFTAVFDNGIKRETRPELAVAVDTFAPVTMGGANFAGVEVASATTSTGGSNASLPTGLNANQGLGISAPSPSSTTGTSAAAGAAAAAGANTGTAAGGGGSAGTAGGGGGNVGGGANTGGGGTSGPGPTPVPRTPQNFSLLAASLPSNIGAASGSTIAAPGANSVTSSIDAQGNFVSISGQPLAEVTRLVDFTPLGTARVRRFAPDASGSGMPRNDTGVVSVPGAGSAIGNSFFQNLATSTLATSGTFYDAVAKVGTVVLTVDQVSSSGVVVPGQTTTVPRISVTDTAPSVADPLQSTQRPFLFFDSAPPNNGSQPKKDYFGSAVFENGLLNNTPTNGKITALSGDNGLIMFIAAPGNPPTIPLGTATANDFDNLCTAEQGKCPTGRHNTKVEQPVQPGVFIVDKVHTTTGPSTDNSDTRGIDLGERFFVIGGTPLPPTPTGLPGAPPGTVTRFAVSDGLNPLGGFAAGKSIEDQFVAPGSSQQPVAFNQFNAFRPEETFVANAPRGDTHLWVISDATGRNPAMRADLQIAADGRSSASASVGGIAALPNGSLALSGATVGSAQLATNASALSINANLGSLGTDTTGTGAHVFGGSGKAPGQIGFFAVSQADVRLGAPGTPAGDQPGTLQVVGQPGNTAPFAFTRLATNVGAPTTLAPSQLNSQGFATGVVQSFTNGQGSLYALSSTRLGDVAIMSSPPNTGFNATLAMLPTSVGELSSDPLAAPAPGGVTGVTTLSFGGSQTTPPNTALVSPATFAAVAPGLAMASIDNDLLPGIENRSGSIAHPVTGAPVDASLPPSNEHLAWGFFLGDLVNQANGQRQDHVNLGFWVAGQPVTFAMLQTLTGTATYGGGLVGTAVEPGRVATVVGQFAQQWDFAARTGTMNASFDKANWNGLGLNMPAATNVFSGTGSSSNIADRTLAVQGSFFHNTATGGALSSTNLPAAVGGLFAVHNSTGTYGANGVLVGARR